MRLKELEKKGFIERAEEKRSHMIVHRRLTEKAKHTLRILMQLVALVLYVHISRMMSFLPDYLIYFFD